MDIIFILNEEANIINKKREEIRKEWLSDGGL